MIKPVIYAALAAGLLCPLASMAAPADAALAAPATKAHKNAKRATGMVTAVDTAKRTLTITSRRDNTATTLTLTPDAKINVTGKGTLASLKVGDTIAAYGTATPEAPTLTATRIAILPEAPARKGKKAMASTAGFHAKRVEGVVATTTPALTMTTPGKVTVTVTTTPATTVETTTPGALTDITVGKTVAVRLTDSTTASEVTVQPDRKGKTKSAKGNSKKAAKRAANRAVPTPLAP